MAFSRRGERDRCHATPQRIYPLDRPRAAPALGADACPIARIAGLAAATGRARGRTGPLRRSRHTTRPLKPQDLSRTSAKEPCTLPPRGRVAYRLPALSGDFGLRATGPTPRPRATRPKQRL